MSSRATIDHTISPSVLLIRLDAIGDALALTPLLHAFREAGIPVDLVLRESNFDAFSAAAARERFVAPFALRLRARENGERIAGFGRVLRENAYTHTLVATEDRSGYELAREVGSTVRAGFTNGWGKPFKNLWARRILTLPVYRPASLDPRGRHECEVLFDLGRPLLGDAVPSRDSRLLRPLVLDRAVAPDPRVAVQVTDKWERMGIALEDVASLLHGAETHWGVRAISSSAEADYALRLERATGIAVETFDAVSDWKDAVTGARGIIAPDSGAIHVAGMVGTPVVAVFSNGPPFRRQTERWAPWAAPHATIAAAPQWPLAALGAMRRLLSEQTAL